MYQAFTKRFIDFCVALVALVFFFPIFIVILVLLFIANHGKPFFFQKRPGKNEKIFSIIKFKTMNDKKDANNELLSDDKRLTGIGKFIRKTSLDEIPQLINVLKGDMSIIGPRPLIVEYLELYNTDQKKRHNVKPGITGWAQVNGRNTLSWSKKFELDVWYVNNISILLDLKIIVLTVYKVFKSDDINSSTSATMEKFVGNN